MNSNSNFFLWTSIFFHVALVVILLKFSQPLEIKKPLEVSQISAQELKRIKKAQKQQQVVDTEIINPQVDPVDADRLGEVNQRVEKETTARNNAPFSQASRAGKSGQTGQQLPSLSQLGNFSRRKVADPPPGNEKQDKINATMQDLEGVQSGDRTLLNSQEFIFYGYHRRVRERLENVWPGTLRKYVMQYIEENPEKRLVLTQSVRVEFVLDSTGKIVRIKILEESGFSALDRSVVEALNRIAKIPGPPRGMLDSNGEVVMVFQFTLNS